jgi:hypothetical protein
LNPCSDRPPAAGGCRPLARRLGAFERVSLAGLIAGPALLVLPFASRGPAWATVVELFCGFVILVLGALSLKAFVARGLVLSWDEEGLLWRGARRLWTEFSGLRVHDEMITSGIAKSVSGLKRFLILESPAGRELRVPFYDVSLCFKGEGAMRDPDWLAFLDVLESRFSLPALSLSAEQAASPAILKKAASGGLPNAAIIALCGIGFILLIVLLATGADAPHIKLVMGVYFLVVAAVTMLQKNGFFRKFLESGMRGGAPSGAASEEGFPADRRPDDSGDTQEQF